jgi:hypothetical protein
LCLSYCSRSHSNSGPPSSIAVFEFFFFLIAVFWTSMKTHQHFFDR